jgi:hypothetical protein
MSNSWWALPLIGLCDSEGDGPSLENRVICYGALFLMWLLFFTGVMEWR